jgi:hypothetical protein
MPLYVKPDPATEPPLFTRRVSLRPPTTEQRLQMTLLEIERKFKEIQALMADAKQLAKELKEK